MRGSSLFVLALALLCQIASSSPVSTLQKRGGTLDGLGVVGTAVEEKAPVNPVNGAVGSVEDTLFRRNLII
jgi:hypothetical protein